MKIAVLANRKNSFVQPVAEGLARASIDCGALSEIHYDGLEILSLPLGLRNLSPRAIAGFALRTTGFRRRFSELVERVAEADVIVVVAHVPGSMSRHTLQNLERLRRILPKKPIVNYDLIYLPTVQKWAPAMLRHDLSDISEAELQLIDPPPFGMERYDWYLVGSPVSELPMPPGPQPYSQIGIDIDDGSLYPAQDGIFRVLVDFEQSRKNYPSYRRVQIDALMKSGVAFEILEGSFSREEIRQKYRKAGALMLAHRESFGLPVCEVQACGARIFTPCSEWAGAHWIKPDLTMAGPGTHSPNFVVYDNDVSALSDMLLEAQETFDPSAVVSTFKEFHPHLYHIDRAVLSTFLERVSSGEIHGRLHQEHADVGKVSGWSSA